MDKIKKLEEIRRNNKEREDEERDKLIDSIYAINYPVEPDNHSEDEQYIDYLERKRNYMEQLLESNKFYDLTGDEPINLDRMEDICLAFMTYESNTEKYRVLGSQMLKYIALLENYIFGDYGAD